MQIMYGIMGQRRLLEWEAGWLPGYEGAQPVRIGNAAHGQLQLDVYGELIDAFYQSRLADLKLDEGSWALALTVIEHVADVWGEPDHGIWEERGERKHYVFSKVMTWVAIDRAIKGAERSSYDAPLDRWRALRDTSIATSARRALMPLKTPLSNPMVRHCLMPVHCCCHRSGFCRLLTREFAARLRRQNGI